MKDKLEAERAYLQEEIKFQYNHENIIGQSEGHNYVLYKVEQIAATDTTVLILGETGTGKELIARAIHNLSLRKDRALVKINCANLTPNLIESELFGHEKGAFTGAHARQPGRFEVANGATLFLDEIGELPLELQPKLLRVIQGGEFERVGSSRTIKVDVRVIAATNRHMEEEVCRRGFVFRRHQATRPIRQCPFINSLAFFMGGCMMQIFNMVPGVVKPEGRFSLRGQFHAPPKHPPAKNLNTNFMKGGCCYGQWHRKMV